MGKGASEEDVENLEHQGKRAQALAKIYKKKGKLDFLGNWENQADSVVHLMEALSASSGRFLGMIHLCKGIIILLGIASD